MCSTVQKRIFVNFRRKIIIIKYKESRKYILKYKKLILDKLKRGWQLPFSFKKGMNL
ncbi:hypothetical protein CLTEP_24200 [Clostridium tepidiprofundi DSM 19306]|uniref:Uncharacterized protein n=1 Tax=Clostridium tepidiprofundi DSM 19306 TaxID=1121338 RepID=A0A151AU66_9CLOT|nr:hypothetical protein CLTEP_24200 [Clostridium tepidiprofundi DSM 19306]